MKKYIFVTGGVCSSLGKGIAAASLGSLLECRGFTVRMIKIDPYINVDAGTMSPYQHGEVYVTDDGAETDLDLGNYARFTGSTLNQSNSITTGQVYQSVIKKEREGRYLGKTVQVIPHITDEIKQRIYKIGEDPDVDFTVVEVGGTVGDIESVPFLEAARQMIHDIGRENVLTVHLTLVPTVTGGELKTKPTQHSVKELQSIGIQPDILLCRAAVELDTSMRRKIANFTNVQLDSVLTARDVNTTIYEIPVIYHQQGLDELVLKKLNIKVPPIDLSPWQHVVDIFNTTNKVARIALVGKYVDLGDTYKSIDEALIHGGIGNEARVEIVKIDSEKLEKGDQNLSEIFKDVDGILIPGGFGQRGIQGMIDTAQYARENKVPLMGICLGMQVMVIEYARNAANLEEADSSEFKPDSPHPVVSLLEEQVDVQTYGGTMRLGRSETHLKENTKIWHIYGSDVIFERHRHRYEVTNNYKDQLTSSGLMLNGFTPDGSLVETVEWPEHPWGIGVQYHPEFLSKPFKPHPLFKSFVEACLKNGK